MVSKPCKRETKCEKKKGTSQTKGGRAGCKMCRQEDKQVVLI